MEALIGESVIRVSRGQWLVTVESPKPQNPDIESGTTMARCRGQEESQKDLWIRFAQ
jgi:hypothetical protein